MSKPYCLHSNRPQNRVDTLNGPNRRSVDLGPAMLWIGINTRRRGHRLHVVFDTAPGYDPAGNSVGSRVSWGGRRPGGARVPIVKEDSDDGRRG